MGTIKLKDSNNSSAPPTTTAVEGDGRRRPLFKDWFVSNGHWTLRPIGRLVYRLLTEPSQMKWLVGWLVLLEFLFGVLIIRKVNYTEIDWRAYMQEVEGVLLAKNYDYQYLRGDTGPLVYPAGFVYFYSLLYYLTDRGTDVLLGQYLFLGFYLCTIVVVGALYRQLDTPPRLLLVLPLSKRIHSIFLLRLFNDPIAMLIAYSAFYFLLKRKFITSTVLYSLAVSVKMNILLFLPGVLLTLYISKGAFSTIFHVLTMVAIQVLLGLPFLTTNWRSYLKGAFDLGRQFDYKWTVNWRFISQPTFNSPPFATCLLILHVSFLLLFLVTCWARPYGGLKKLVLSGLWTTRQTNNVSPLTNSQIASYLMVSNLIGVTFSRSLHYQFYSWYFHTLPYLLYRTTACFPLWFQATLLLTIEYSWNRYPSTPFSSGMLLTCHLALLAGLWLIDYSIGPFTAHPKRD